MLQRLPESERVPFRSHPETAGRLVFASGVQKAHAVPARLPNPQINTAIASHDVERLARTYPDSLRERSLLHDETRELRRLLDHIDLFVNEFGR